MRLATCTSSKLNEKPCSYSLLCNFDGEVKERQRRTIGEDECPSYLCLCLSQHPAHTSMDSDNNVQRCTDTI